jgi:hypothetical protein
LTTWHRPIFVLGIIYRSLNTAVDRIRHISGDLTEEMLMLVRRLVTSWFCTPECKPRVKHGNELATGSTRNN